MAEPVAEAENGGESEEGEEVRAPEPETEEEKMAKIRSVKFPLIPEYQEIMQRTLPLYVRKGAKSKTEIQEKEVAHIVRALALNPTDEQIEKLTANARYKEVGYTTKGHFSFQNIEQRVFEYLFFEPQAFKRHPKEKILEALHKISGGQPEMDAETLKKMVRTKGSLFTEAEATLMLRVARDKDTGKVYLDEYAKVLADDGLPAPKDPLEPISEQFR